MYPQHLAGGWSQRVSTDATSPQQPILMVSRWAGRIDCGIMGQGGDTAARNKKPMRRIADNCGHAPLSRSRPCHKKRFSRASLLLLSPLVRPRKRSFIWKNQLRPSPYSPANITELPRRTWSAGRGSVANAGPDRPEGVSC